jgi:PadR family transcriptional regulator AphA
MTEVSTSHFWAESYGNLYPTLRRLERDGLVSSEIVGQEGRPDKRVYRPTERGRTAFREWLAEPVEPAPVRNELLLKLFFGAAAPAEVSRRHLQGFRERQAELLKTYRSIEAWLTGDHADDPELPYWLITLSYGRHIAEAALRWCDESLAGLPEASTRERSVS